MKMILRINCSIESKSWSESWSESWFWLRFNVWVWSESFGQSQFWSLSWSRSCPCSLKESIMKMILRTCCIPYSESFNRSASLYNCHSQSWSWFMYRSGGWDEMMIWSQSWSYSHTDCGAWSISQLSSWH